MHIVLDEIMRVKIDYKYSKQVNLFLINADVLNVYINDKT